MRVQAKRKTGTGRPAARRREAPPCLLVLKGSRVREYLQQNQRILAAPYGAATRTRYNLTWVSSRVDLAGLQPGLSVLILFSDHPYERYIPVRHARLAAARRESDYLDLELTLEELIDPEVLAEDTKATLLAAAARAGAVEPFGLEGRKVFLDLAPAGFILPRALRMPQGETARAVQHSASELAAWRGIVDFLTSSDETREHYQHAVFFRPVGLRRLAEEGVADLSVATAGPDLLESAGAALEFGATYRLDLRAYNPHLSPHELALVRLAPDGGGALSFPDLGWGGFPRLVTDGSLVLHFTPRRSGPLTLEVSVTPGAETATILRLENLLVVGEKEEVAAQSTVALPAGGDADSRPTGDLEVGLDPAELLALDDWLCERLKPGERERLELFRRFLGRWSRDTSVAERHAELAFAAREWREVLTLLEGREGLSEETKHRRFLAALEERRTSGLVEEAAGLAWTAEHDPYFERFLALVPGLPPETRHQLADRLPFRIWGDDKSCRFFRALMDLDPHPALVEVIAGALREYQHLFGLSPDEALNWLVRQGQRLDRPSVTLIGELVWWMGSARQTDEALDLLVEGLLGRLFAAGGSAAVRQVQDSLRPHLDFAGRLRLGLTAVDLYLQAPAPAPAGVEEGVNAALFALLDLLCEALDAGDMWESESLAGRLRAIVGQSGQGETRAVDPHLAEWVVEGIASFRAQLAEWQPHRAKLSEDAWQKGLELGDRWAGRTLHLFTGHQGGQNHVAERYAELAMLLGGQVALEVHGFEERACLDDLRPERDLVVVLPRWAGHSDTGFIDERCRRLKVPCFRMPQHVVSPERVVVEVWGR